MIVVGPDGHLSKRIPWLASQADMLADDWTVEVM